MKPLFVEDVSAICNLGDDWPTIWSRLLQGDRITVPFNEIEDRLTLDAEVAGIPGLSRHLDADRTGVGAASRLAADVPSHLTRPRRVDRLRASNHSESDVVVEIAMKSVRETGGDPALIATLEVDPMPLHAPTLAGLAARRSVWSYSACASGVHALALAAGALASGPNDRAIVVAADALSTLAVAGFSGIGAVSRSGAPPLTTGSDGILIGEGAAAMTLSRVSGRVAVIGIGMSCDAGHQIHPDANGMALSRTILQALLMSGLAAADIRSAILHGTGTAASDTVEAAVVSEIFGDRAIPVTSLKGLIGHCMGAAGLFNVLAAVAACEQGLLPPVGRKAVAPRAGIDVVAESARCVPPGGPVLVLASGFGGNHVALIVGAVS